MMRSIAIGWLLPVAAALCLPDGIPPEKRQNLVNPNGETYPVGFFIAGYAASYASNIMGAMLVEEILGYNVTFNLDAVGSGSIASYYGVTGCRNYNNVTDRGCMQGVTYYHVCMEAWLGGYVAEWEHIQNTYTSMAPKDLGSMGYPGIATMFMPKQIQEQAYSTAGKSLEFYRAWNVSWNTPWTYFGGLDSVNKSYLAPCSKEGLMFGDNAAMRWFVERTGDTDGVVITNDVYAARCDDGYWWTPASCRATPSQCVPWLTAGNGWAANEFMQKFTIFKMPVAIGIAATWGDYTSIPLDGTMTMYWWAPDPTFLELSPIKVQYPSFKSREWDQGIMTSEVSAARVSTISSRDLEVLAPIVERMVDNIDIPMSQIDVMLLDQKNTGDSWENVTCRWIQANRALWQQWIPDESACFAGFGLYDSVLNTFTQQRENATNKIVCQACSPGTYSQKLEDNYGNGITYICVPCGLGTSQSSGASLSCKACKAGEYQDELESKECKRCPFGTYQDEEGQTACKACPESTNTLGFGSVTESDCGCPENFIDMDKTGAYNCVACGEGLTCPALSQLVDLERGQSDIGEQFTPKIQKGYYATVEEPTEIYRCGNPEFCPGGTPGSCAGGLLDTPCSSCDAGATWTGSVCEDCAGWRQALWGLAVVCIFVFLTMAYYLTTSKVTAKATVLFATTASFGMLVMSMQNLGLIGMMTVEWPATLQGLFSVCQFLLLDIDSYGFSCVAGNAEPIRYLLSALIFPVGVAWLLLGFGVSKLFAKKRHWEGPKVVSTMGAFLQVGFSTMSATSLAPMMCYQHPNGQRSLLKYPGVICGSSDHTVMLVIGTLLLVFFVLGFVALCTFAVMMVPKWSSTHRHHFVAAVRFLVFRFRLDAWWFGVPLLVRGPLINLPVVLATDYPPIQVVTIAMILTTMMVMQMLAWPWKVPMLNLTDCIISFGIVLMVTTSALYLNKIDSTMQAFAQVVSTTMLGGIGAAIGVMIMMTVSALVYRSAMGGKKELKFFNLGAVAESPELAKKVKELAVELEKMDQVDLASKIAALSVFDVEIVAACITLLATEVAPPAEDGVTFKFNKRIASASFDIALKRKPQSLRASRGVTASAAEPETENENEETNAVAELPEARETMKSTWI